VSRQSAIEFMFVPHKSDTIFRNVNDAWLNFLFFPSSHYPLSPLSKAKQLPYCCDTQHLLVVAARCYFFIWTKDLPCRYYSSSRLSRSSLHSPGPKGWKLKRGMVDTTRSVEWTLGVHVGEITHQMLAFSRIKIRI